MARHCQKLPDRLLLPDVRELSGAPGYLRRTMTDVPTRRMLLLALALLIGSAGAVRADDDDDDDGDHYRAGRAVQQGEARPLAEILAAIRPQLGGEVIGVDFKRKDGRYV